MLLRILAGAIIYFSLANVHAADLSNGEYIYRLAGCVHCHTSERSKPLAGGRALVTPFGLFFPPNISPDSDHGIGRWTEDEFRSALRTGRSPRGRAYYPAFPYPSFAQMSDKDISDLYAYIMNETSPMDQKSRAHEIAFPYDHRWLNRVWQFLFFSSAASSQNPARGDAWNRGAYLVRAVAHCAECHTPRNSLGALEVSLWMAGSKDLLPGKVVPNITPDAETGTGTWSEADWDRFLKSGFKPDRTTVGGEMAFVIQSTATLTDADRAAVIEYLRALTPIRNFVKEER